MLVLFQRSVNTTNNTTREPFTRVTKKRSGLSVKTIVRDAQSRSVGGKGEGTSAPRWYTWCNWCTSPHASLHSYKTLLSAGYNGCHALWSVDTLCSVVRVMIRDIDSFRLSYNDCLDGAMRVLHRISSKHGPHGRASASYFELSE